MGEDNRKEIVCQISIYGEPLNGVTETNVSEGKEILVSSKIFPNC